mmetsp:Transcript_22680/g.36289  ORF Transcript_22680/g.36289 Transcript_22680/m.36289 type:complete len:152 (-) Transcript_22680:90-545(-)
MLLILQHDSTKYSTLVTSQVYHKLVDTHNCETKSNACTPNPIATSVRSHVCPLHTACAPSIVDQIEATARWSSSQAVKAAFETLRQSVFHHKALDQSGLNRQGHLTNPGHVVVHAGVGVVTQPAAFEKAAESGMGYQPAGFVNPSATWTGH